MINLATKLALKTPQKCRYDRGLFDVTLVNEATSAINWNRIGGEDLLTKAFENIFTRQCVMTCQPDYERAGLVMMSCSFTPTDGLGDAQTSEATLGHDERKTPYSNKGFLKAEQKGETAVLRQRHI